MNKKLPKLYVNKIDKKIDNNEKIYYSAMKVKETVATKTASKPELKTINEKINDLFNAPDYVYKKKAMITLKDKTVINKDIIGEENGKLITIDDELIDIDDIKDIKF